MRKSIATVSLSGPWTESSPPIAEAGFDGVEIFENDLLASPLSPEEVRRRAADLGLTSTCSSRSVTSRRLPPRSSTVSASRRAQVRA